MMRPFFAVATRYDKLAVRHEATVLVAAINAWLRPALSKHAPEYVPESRSRRIARVLDVRRLPTLP
ncbi:hypothetical protein ACWGIB_26530 [Streptomyces xiamenensis]